MDELVETLSAIRLNAGQRLDLYSKGLEMHQYNLRSLRRALEQILPLLTDCQARACGIDADSARKQIIDILNPYLGK